MARLQRAPNIEYIENTFSTESQTQKEIRQRLSENNKEGINIHPLEGHILKFLIESFQIKTIVEIGTLYGYSTTWMADALPDDGNIYSIEVNEQNYARAKKILYSSLYQNKVELFLGSASEILKGLTHKGPFDMVFIDADKAGYSDYLLWAEENIRPGGLIVGDNTFLFGHVYDTKDSKVKVSEKQKMSMIEFNKRLSDSSKYRAMMIPTPEGLTIAQKIF